MLITKFGSIPSQNNFWLEGWSYGKEISIPADSIDADLSYFPLPVYLRDYETILGYTSDLCTGGTPISSGDNSSYPKTNAFNNNNGTDHWMCDTSGSGTWIGYDFGVGVAKCIRRARYLSNSVTGDNPTSVAVEYSDDNSTWTRVGTYTVAQTASTWWNLDFSDNGTHRYWRVVQLNGITWVVDEVEMLEVTSNILPNFDFSQCKPDGADIRFTDASLNLLKFERKQHGLVTYTADLCSGGTAICGTYYSGYPASNGFDDSTSTYWRTSTGANDTAWLGYQFATAKTIRRIRYLSYSSTTYNTAGLEVAYSNNGTNWTVVGNYTVEKTASIWQNLDIPATIGAHAYWRVRNISSENLRIPELEMCEIATNFAVYNVQVPTVTNLSDTKVYMWWGNANAYNVSIEAWQDQTGKELTYNGNVKIVRNSVTDHYASFDGSTGFYSLADSADWFFNTSDFCIETRLYRTATSSRNYYILIDGNGTAASSYAWRLAFTAANELTASISDGTNVSSVTTSGGSYTTGQWYDIAFIKTGGNLYLYVNGVQVAIQATTRAVQNETTSVYIGGLMSTEPFQGYMSGVRITNGRARYTGTYTPPTTFEIDGTDVVLCTNFDTVYDNNYIAVMHLNDKLVDASGTGNNNGSETGTTVVDTDFGKVRNFNGTSDAVRNLPAGSCILGDNPYTVFAMAIADQTMVVGASTLCAWGHPSNTNAGSKIEITSGNIVRHGWNVNEIYTPTAMTQAQEYHVGASYDQTTRKLYLEGIVSAYDTPVDHATTQGTFQLGCTTDISNFWKGKIRDVRLSNIARSDAWIKAESLALKNSLITMTDLT